MATKKQVIDALGLEAHIEGGYFKETYKAQNGLKIKTDSGQRTTMTSIYYLLTSDSPVGHFHLNKSDIVHYFHAGDPLEYLMIDEDGQLKREILGPDIVNGHKLQLTVTGGTWKSSNLIPGGQQGYGLIGEAVAPGFEYQDMSLGTTDELCSQFPQHEHVIRQFTRD